MRRGQDSEGGPSASPSKPTSETGSDSKDKPAAANQKFVNQFNSLQLRLTHDYLG